MAHVLGSSATDPTSWDCRGVARWLSACGLGSYKDVFTQKNITGSRLLTLDEDELTRLVPDAAQRKRLMVHLRIASFKGGNAMTMSGGNASDVRSIQNQKSAADLKSVRTQKAINKSSSAASLSTKAPSSAPAESNSENTDIGDASTMSTCSATPTGGEITIVSLIPRSASSDKIDHDRQNRRTVGEKSSLGVLDKRRPSPQQRWPRSPSPKLGASRALGRSQSPTEVSQKTMVRSLSPSAKTAARRSSPSAKTAARSLSPNAKTAARSLSPSAKTAARPPSPVEKLLTRRPSPGEIIAEMRRTRIEEKSTPTSTLHKPGGDQQKPVQLAQDGGENKRTFAQHIDNKRNWRRPGEAIATPQCETRTGGVQNKRTSPDRGETRTGGVQNKRTSPDRGRANQSPKPRQTHSGQRAVHGSKPGTAGAVQVDAGKGGDDSKSATSRSARKSSHSPPRTLSTPRTQALVCGVRTSQNPKGPLGPRIPLGPGLQVECETHERVPLGPGLQVVRPPSALPGSSAKVGAQSDTTKSSTTAKGSPTSLSRTSSHDPSEVWKADHKQEPTYNVESSLSYLKERPRTCSWSEDPLERLSNPVRWPRHPMPCNVPAVRGATLSSGSKSARDSTDSLPSSKRPEVNRSPNPSRPSEKNTPGYEEWCNYRREAIIGAYKDRSPRVHADWSKNKVKCYMSRLERVTQLTSEEHAKPTLKDMKT